MENIKNLHYEAGKQILHPAFLLIGKFKSRPGYFKKQQKTSKLTNHKTQKSAKVSQKVSLVNFETAYISMETDIPKSEIEPWLVVPAPTSKDQRWIIKYYIWDGQKQEIVLKRDVTLNSIPDIAERERQANHLLKYYRQCIREGYYHHPEAAKKQAEEKILEKKKRLTTIADLVRKVIQEKKTGKKQLRDSTLKVFDTQGNIFLTWLESQNAHNLLVRNIDEKFIDQFFIYLLNDRNSEPRTHNNYLNTINNIFSYGIKYGIIAQSPTKNIEFLEEPGGKNIAYTLDQQQELVEFMRKRYPRILFASLFMYYTLFRTNEISHIQRKYIGLQTSDKIFLPARWSKNRSDRNATITAQLAELLDEFGIMRLKPDDYIISRHFMPGAEQYRYLGERFRENVLNKLGFGNLYTFYSWKHTGVVSAWNAGVDPNAIYRQGGWKSWSSFQVYLKSLGLFENTEVKYKYPTPPGM